MQNQASTKARANARKLRSTMTDGERLLWSKLRSEQLGVKFRRQHPLGHYVADFACLAPRVVVELDGSQHADQQAYDLARDAFFKSKGFAVLRFPANAPFTELEGVLQAILTQVQAATPLAPSQPSPNWGGSPA